MKNFKATNKAKLLLVVISIALFLALGLAVINNNAKKAAIELANNLNENLISTQEAYSELEEKLASTNAELETTQKEAIAAATDAALKLEAAQAETAAVVAELEAIKAEPDELPKLYFTGDISEMNEKSDVRQIAVRFDDDNYPFSGYAKLTIQGTSSLSYAKKNFTIKFYKDETCETQMPVNVGWGEQYKYCLKANWIDKTHARNIVTARLAAQAQKDNPFFAQAPNAGLIDGFPIEIYVNDEFHGIYTFNIPKDAWMFGMDEDNPNHIVFCGETWNGSNVFKELPDYESWGIEVGTKDDAALAKLTSMFEFVISSSDEVFRRDFQQYIDFESALNYIVFMDYAYLPDNAGKNMLLATYDGKIWAPTLYDLDTSWGSYWTGNTLYDYSGAPTHSDGNQLFVRIKKNFPEELNKRYFELRENVLSKENIMSEFTAFVKQIPKNSLLKEQKKWGVIPGFDLYQIEDYIDSITDEMDKKYASLIPVVAE